MAMCKDYTQSKSRFDLLSLSWLFGLNHPFKSQFVDFLKTQFTFESAALINMQKPTWVNNSSYLSLHWGLRSDQT